MGIRMAMVDHVFKLILRTLMSEVVGVFSTHVDLCTWSSWMREITLVDKW